MIFIGVSILLTSYIVYKLYIKLKTIDKIDNSFLRDVHRYEHLLEFLESADDAYIDSFKNRTMKPFCEYCSNDLCGYIIYKLRTEEEIAFGTNKYRRRKWTLITNGTDYLIIRKEVEYDNVYVNRNVSIEIGDKQKETWKIKILDAGKYLIESIA